MLSMLSLVVPCYNEAASLQRLYAETVEATAGLSQEFELILVNDGSRDNTLDVARQLADHDPRVRVLSFSRNFGKEPAMLAGLRAARGDAVAIMDADLQHPPQLLRDMVGVLDRGEADQVVARRSRDGDSKVRTFFSRMFYKVVNGMVDVELTDGVGDFRVMSRRAVDALLQLGEQNRFSKGLFSWIGYPTVMLSYKNVLRDAGESSWTFKALVNYGIDGVVSFNQKPLRAVFIIGVAAIVASLLYLVWLLVGWLISGVQTPGYLTTITAVTLFSGVQLISLAIIAEYIGRIYLEVKGRPHYIIAESINDPADPAVTALDHPATNAQLERGGHA
ncbi:glycosyltransferase family 2 protein [Propionibacteriaceae bacterium G1746]|uniref:glycosyltransferase family 2 protein n=1 Tax=Aestuariimicrobium sp. G57 TaxID=3418485 RepID=UPI003C1CAF08